MTTAAAPPAIREALAAHFVIWHELGAPLPPGEWRCTCGAKFGFSGSAIDHQAEAVASRLALAEATQ